MKSYIFKGQVPPSKDPLPRLPYLTRREHCPTFRSLGFAAIAEPNVAGKEKPICIERLNPDEDWWRKSGHIVQTRLTIGNASVLGLKIVVNTCIAFHQSSCVPERTLEVLTRSFSNSPIGNWSRLTSTAFPQSFVEPIRVSSAKQLVAFVDWVYIGI